MHVYINVCLRYFHMHQYIYNRKNLFIYLPIDVIQVYNPYNTGHGSTCIYCIACKYIFGGNKNCVKERIGTVNLLGRKINIFPNILFSKSSAIHWHLENCNTLKLFSNSFFTFLVGIFFSKGKRLYCLMCTAYTIPIIDTQR